MSEKTYEDGLLEGRIGGLEQMQIDTKGRLDNHAQRLRIMERVIWAMFGIGVFVNFWPKIQVMLGG